jgi:hypothetical protein
MNESARSEPSVPPGTAVRGVASKNSSNTSAHILDGDTQLQPLHARERFT